MNAQSKDTRDEKRNNEGKDNSEINPPKKKGEKKEAISEKTSKRKHALEAS